MSERDFARRELRRLTGCLFAAILCATQIAAVAGAADGTSVASFLESLASYAIYLAAPVAVLCVIVAVGRLIETIAQGAVPRVWVA